MLTRREEFAKAAMQGMLSSAFDGFTATEPGSPSSVAKLAVSFADALEAALGPIKVGPDGRRDAGLEERFRRERGE